MDNSFCKLVRFEYFAIVIIRVFKFIVFLINNFLSKIFLIQFNDTLFIQ